jgi:signal transduction histidine kinase
MIDSTHEICADIIPEIRIEGDPNRIKQVIRIFVDNAVKYTPEGKKIQIKIYKEDKFSVVEITDAGIGISKEDLDNIFERFYRADESRTKTTGGYGLGLSIAKIIILQHGGKIRVRSKPGSGSKFSVYIPMIETD